MTLTNIKNEDIFKYFIQISNIPRCSHHEAKIAEYLANFAKEHKLEYIRDKYNNLLIKRTNKTSNQTIALQAHIDMVCIKAEHSNHNFNIDPILLSINNNILKAKETTLGADNGIGAAYMLALLDAPNFHGPNLECIFTTNEEDGMTGAENFDMINIKANRLINLDSEDEGKLYVSCAGGIICKLTVPITYKLKEGFTYTIKIDGLKGGHSGLEIDKNRGNAIKFAARILNYLQEESINFRLININGGQKHNAIPEQAQINIMLKSKEQEAGLSAIINNSQNIFRKEYDQREPNVKVTLIENEISKVKVFSKSTTISLIGLLNLLPDGVIKTSEDIKDLVETSTNIGEIYSKPNHITIITSIRSSKNESINSIVGMFNQLKIAFNLQLKTEHSYPGWNYNKNSELKEIAKDVYKNLYNQSLEEIAIHAGLECGFFANKKADLDIISFGPTIKNIHTIDESVDLDSVRRVFIFLKELLNTLK
ncbi:MAG: beta-Ala-His dipeptidase [Firmicutes bacterium]|nr:beta-Ala-His dipeptidase [Bacillota bacterium]